MKYYHVDVFSSRPMSGNGLTVVFADKDIENAQMLEITQEFRQFETAFIFPQNSTGAYPLRIFTMQEELPFAGHPVLGAAAVVHRVFRFQEEQAQISLDLSGRQLRIESLCKNNLHTETMNQGKPECIRQTDHAYYKQIAGWLSLRENGLETDLPVEVISTGLPYLIVPVRDIEHARISGKGFEAFLDSLGAKFVYVFDPQTLECRTWDNDGLAEDVATGSAAGPLCAYLVRHGIKKQGEVIRLKQGRHVGRPSEMEGWMEDGNVFIRGGVSFFALGELFWQRNFGGAL